MSQQNDYQFVMIPQQLSSCLDANCHKMLTVLIGLNSILSNEDGWFYRSNGDLQDDARLSETLVRATLDTLYQAGIINIDCIGKGRGRRTNRIHINFESFKKYEQYSFNDIRNNPDLWIDTIKYKGSGFATSYSQKVRTNTEQSQEVSQKVRTNTEQSQEVSQKVRTSDTSQDTSQSISQDSSQNTSQKVRTNTNTINTLETLDSKEYNLINKKEEKEPCTKEELNEIYLNNFGDLLSIYPSLNYNLLLLNDLNDFYECYIDIVNELKMKIAQASQRNITETDILKSLQLYLEYTGYSYQ